MMKKRRTRLLSMVLALAMLLTMMPVSALAGDEEPATSGSCGENGDNVTWTFDSATRTLKISGTGEMNSYSTTSAVPWYDLKDQITAFVVEEGVTHIGAYTLGALNEKVLEKIVMPQSVTSFATHAFANAGGYRKTFEKITTAGVGDQYDYEFNWTTEIPDSAFDMNGLEKVVLPDTIQKIGKSSFRAYDLKEINLPDGLLEIGEYAFCNTSLTNIEIPDSVTTIGEYAFQSSEKLESIKLPCNLTSIPYKMAYGCDSLKNIKWPNEFTIEEWAFAACGLTDLTLPKGVKSIGESAFYHCYDLNTVSLPSDLLEIEKSAFLDCKALRTVDLPDNLSALGACAFSGCESLEEIDLPSTLTEIQTQTFYQCKALKNIAIPNGVTNIDWDAFRECTSLTSITIPDSVTSIGENAFYGCDNLISVTLSDGVTSISTYVFYDCSSLTSIAIPDDVTSIGAGAFRGCSGLTSITIPDSVTSIGNLAFNGCDSLTDVYYAGSEAEWDEISIGSYNSDLTTATIHYNSTGPAKIASGQCGDNLTWTLDANGTLTISGTGAMYNYEDVEDTPWYAYETRIKSVVVEDDVTTIGNSAFDAMAIQKISIGSSVNFVGSNAFYVSPDGALVIEFSGAAPKISSEVFSSCGSGIIDIYYDPSTSGWDSVVAQEFNLETQPIILWISSDNATDKLPVSDRLSFANSQTYFGNEENGYFITQDDYDKLTSQLSWIERISLASLNVGGRAWFPAKWSGSCYGMSGLVALGRLGIINPTDIQSSAQTMFDVEQGNEPISQSTQSLINYYFIQQMIPGIKSVRAEFMKQPQSTQIEQMERCITAAEQNEKTALICFKYYSDEQKEVSHAVLGYAIEQGTFKLSINGTEYQFDRRVLICDPNTAGDQQVASESALYYNDSQWAMMGDYNIVSTSNDLKVDSQNDTAQLLIVTSDPDYINAIDYKTGARNYTNSMMDAFLSGLVDTFILENTDTGERCSISQGRFNGINTINDNMVILDNIDAISDAKDETIIALPLNNAYTVTTEDQAVDVSLAYENLFLFANSEAPGKVTFDPKGEIQMETSTPANGSLSLTANDGHTTMPWNVVTAEAADIKNLSLSLSQTQDGIVLEGDDLKEITVYGTNNEETVKLNFGTEENKVLITSPENEEKDQLLIMKDADRDGSFETPLDVIRVTGVSLNQQLATLKVDESLQLTATIVPSTAQNQSINWTSSDDAVASVDQAGLVTAKSAGTAIITAKTVDGDYTATCEVTVIGKNDDEEPIGYRITLNPSGGTVEKTEMVTAADGTLSELPTPTYNGYTFKGWYTAANGGEKVNKTTVFTQDTTIFAQWEQTASDSGASDDNSDSDSSSSSGSSSGGSTSSNRYTVSVADDIDNGSISVSPSRAERGDTVTITVKPDEGYKLHSLIALDSDGDRITIEKERENIYTFEMPSDRVTIEATFAEIEEQPTSLPFNDVSAEAYYADAVLWAVENDITNGTTVTTFSPNASCTRAQIVTFLWRAAGSPEPKSTENPFTDVASNVYYTDAVLWAVENGITNGTSATTFNPDATVSRGQTVTFLWRYEDSPSTSGNSFTDVAANAYYAEAVAWAVANEITNGTSSTTFSPNDACTRAQIVTFLYRDLA